MGFSVTSFFWLVVEPTHLKNVSQIGSFPVIEVKMNKYLSCHHLVFVGFLPLGTPNNQFFKWMDGNSDFQHISYVSKHFLCKDLVHHPIELVVLEFQARILGSNSNEKP